MYPISSDNDYVGQKELKEKVDKLINIVKSSTKEFPHILLVGSKGIGKKTFVKRISSILGVNIRNEDSKSIKKEGDLAAILTNLEERSILILNEIHQLNKKVLDELIKALKKYEMIITVGKGHSSRQMTLSLPHFTLIGTTTQINQVDSDLMNAVFSVYHFDSYSTDEIINICKIVINKNESRSHFSDNAIKQIVKYSDGTPSDANRLIIKIIAYAKMKNVAEITLEVINEYLHLANYKKTNSEKYIDRHISYDTKRKVWRRDNGRCIQCGNNEYLEFDHIIPVSKGGSNTERNIQLLCEKCNRSKGATI